MASIISARDLHWRGSKLYFGGITVGSVVADKTYPKMWRAIRPDGSLSDIANLTRARDAVVSQVLRKSNQETALEGVYMRQKAMA